MKMFGMKGSAVSARERQTPDMFIVHQQRPMGVQIYGTADVQENPRPRKQTVSQLARAFRRMVD